MRGRLLLALGSMTAVAALLLSALGLLAAGPVGAQTGGTAPEATGDATTAAPASVGLPGDTVAVVPSLDAQPGPARNDLDVTNVYVAPSLDPDAPDVVVQFAAPFALPAASYAVSVVVGDPGGARLRASLRSSDPAATPTGVLEANDGSGWTEAGATDVAFDPSGFVVVAVPHTTAPEGDAVWVEINVGNMATPTRITPYYDRSAFFHTAEEGTLPAPRVARVLEADGTLAPDAATLAAAPVVRVADGRIEVDAPAPGAAVGDTDVAGVTDTVVIAPDYYDGGRRAAEVAIDWTAGTVTLRDAEGTDRSGDRAWVLAGFAGGAATTGSVPPAEDTAFSFDLATIASALGTTLDPTTYGIGLTRSLELADGREVIAEGLLASQAFFDRRPVVLPDDPVVTEAATPAPASGEGGDGSAMAAVVGLVALVALSALIVLAWSRRSRAGAGDEAAGEDATAGDGEDSDPPTGEDRVPWGRDDGARTATAEMEQLREITGAVPVVVVDDDPPEPADEAHAGSGVDETLDLTAAAASSDEPSAVEGEPVDAGGPDPADVLAALEVDLSAFRTRLDALPDFEEPPVPDRR